MLSSLFHYCATHCTGKVKPLNPSSFNAEMPFKKESNINSHLTLPLPVFFQLCKPDLPK